MEPLLAADGLSKAINIPGPAEAYGLIEPTGSVGSSPAGVSLQPEAAAPAHVADELLVQFLPGTAAEARAQVRGLVGASLAETIHTAAMQRNGSGVLERIRVAAGGPGLAQVQQALARSPLVAFVDLNYIYKPSAVSNDTYYTNGSLWGMYSDDSSGAIGPSGTTNQFGSQAEKAWNDNITGSANVVVGIIDEGIQVTHPDLVNNIWVNPYETAGDGIDNDGNGYVDDIHGWDFVYNNNSVYDAGEDSHGTHVAGTIGGSGGNGSGVVGVNWAVTMISTKFLGPSGGTTANAVKALDYLTDLKTRHGINLVATNNSWGGGGYSQALHDAIIRSAKKEILFVAAAGNSTSNNDTTSSYPSNYNATVGTSTQTAASYDNVIAVASITSTGAISSFSSYGATTVDIGAPGSGIFSSVPTNTYASYNGTSMATPHVTGAAALYASRQSAGVSAAAIKAALLESATPTTSLTGKTVTGGRLNIYGALQRSAFLNLDRAFYTLPGQIGISVNDGGANQSSTSVDTVTVQISSTSETTPITVVLTETGANTGRFNGSIQLASGSPQLDSTLQANDGNQITAVYAAVNADNQTVTARVDASAPAISAVAATAKATSSEIRWTTNEVSSTEVLYGTSSGNLTSSTSVAGMVTAHAATLGGLLPSCTYYYQVRSRDGAGNVTTSSEGSFTTASPAPILFVDDDQGASYEQFFTKALQDNGYSYDSWNAFTIGATPTAADLRNYNLVIWTTGYDFTASTAGLSSGEQTAIAGYLDAGGRIFISGQDVLYNGVSTTFLSNYLKVASFTDDVSTTAHTETGAAGNPVSNGLSLSLAPPSGFTLYVDAVTPVSGAEGTFLHGVTTATSPYSAINYRGNYGSGGFGVVFSTAPFEAVSSSAGDPNNQRTLMKRVVEYLNGSTVQAGVTVGTPSAATTGEDASSVTFTVSLASAPTADVTIPVSSSDTTEATVSTASLVFTSENWSIPQMVRVTGVNDAIDDGNIPYLVVLGTATSADAAYNGRNPADISLSNLDDDTAGITVSSPSGQFTNELGTTTVSFSVKLNSEPLADVSIPISSSNTNEATVSTASLVFTPGNWNTIQTVTVTGVADGVFDGDKAYTVVTGAATSTDPLYSLINPADIALTNIDIDPAPATRFFVVNDATLDNTYKYSDKGIATGTDSIVTGNSKPRGIAASRDGTSTWVADANRRVYVYRNGAYIGDWLAGSLPSNAIIEGIATDETNIWILDNRNDRVYYYAGAAAKTSGTATLTNSFALSTSGTNPNTTPKDMVYGKDSQGNGYLWVVNDATIDRVFRYGVTAATGAISLQTSWTLNSSNSLPTGIALDPTASSGDLWIVNNGTTKQVFRYQDGRQGVPLSSEVAFNLSSAVTNPQGIADPNPAALRGAGAAALDEPIVSPRPAQTGERLADADADADAGPMPPAPAPLAGPSGDLGPTARPQGFRGQGWSGLFGEGRGYGRRAQGPGWRRRQTLLAWLPFHRLR